MILSTLQSWIITTNRVYFRNNSSNSGTMVTTDLEQPVTEWLQRPNFSVSTQASDSAPSKPKQRACEERRGKPVPSTHHVSILSSDTKILTRTHSNNNNNNNNNNRLGALHPMPSCLCIGALLGALQWVPARIPTVHWEAGSGPQQATTRSTARPKDKP